MKDTLRELLKGYIEKAQKKLTVAEKLLTANQFEGFLNSFVTDN